MRLRDGAIEIGLLFGDGVFATLNLFRANWVGGALSNGGKLAFEPHADRI